MGYIRSFAPWIVVSVLTGMVDVRWAALAGLVLAAAIVARQRRAGQGWDALVVEASAALYFAGWTAWAFAAPHSPAVTTWGNPLATLWLAAMAWGSLAAGRPFTLGIARTQVPEALWTSPVFLRVNRIITAVWAAAFTLSGAASLLLRLEAPDAGAARIAVTVIGFVVPVVFTVRYPKIARERAQARAHAQAAAGQ
ncbi:hypothetical protein BIV57_20095 [Mangrovactinospora gilvigrisea]|uniref:DUF3159 domain-containing protein n=1 Tax=Mangrovactinospora gilvigrisea TaxID=1428644 RepID=A0A1J7BAM4_9ACTN|nr:hypothetical protein [Mangrovactinospora gilvigrisea]OIV35707.1 hypothetical protein BIV57_20095 [Mangrovactinospora gilvigrisea]